MLNRTIRCIWIGHDPEESADSASASEDDGAATANETSDGVLLSETVYYADGTRAGVKTPDDGYWTTRYIGSLIYEGEPGQETLEGIITDNGFIQWNGSAASSRMQYFLRDHLGSVRVIAEDRHTVIGRTDYLPFGVRMSGDGLTGGNATSRSSFFGFSGKENEMWGGYDTADGDITPHWLKGERYQHFGARAYDPVSCIFMQVDPMAEKYYGMTPYGYCAGNPVMMVDPDGSELTAYYSARGKYITTIDDGNDGAKMLVVKKMSLNDAIQSNAVIPLPSEEVLSMMDSAYAMTEENGKEHGFQVDVNGNVGDMGEGDEGSIKIPTVYSKTGEYVDYDVHTHPMLECDSNSSYDSNANSSDADRSGYVGNHPNVVLGYKGDYGVQTRMIGFYHKSGDIGDRDYYSFKKSVRKAQRDWQIRTNSN